MEIKTLFPKAKEKPIKSPWVLKEIGNGIKAENFYVVKDVVVKKNKNVPIQYFEYDRIFGKGAFADKGIFKVMDMFDELKEATKDTIGYIFKDSIYLNHSKGILKRNIKSGIEDFYTKDTLRNKALSCYLDLDYKQNPEPDEGNSNRIEVLSQSTELQTSEG